jgi:CheY-like chemotaxis protein
MPAILGRELFQGGFRPLQILVVDDDRDNADSWAILLRANGHQVDVAYNGPDAVALVQAEVPDVVMMDLAMPIQDGYATARQIRAVCFKKPLMIAVTGLGSDADRNRSYAEGFDYYFMKPVDSRQVLLVLNEFATSLSYH